MQPTAQHTNIWTTNEQKQSHKTAITKSNLISRGPILDVSEQDNSWSQDHNVITQTYLGVCDLKIIKKKIHRSSNTTLKFLTTIF